MRYVSRGESLGLFILTADVPLRNVEANPYRYQPVQPGYIRYLTHSDPFVVHHQCSSPPVIMGCCGASLKCIRITSITTLVAAVALVGISFALFAGFGNLATQVLCITTGLKDLAGLGGTAGGAATMLPTGLLDQINQLIGLLQIVSITPAILAFISVAIAGLLACRNSGSFFCAKCFNLIAMLLVFIAVIFYFICGALGTAIDTPEVQAQLTMITSVCDDTLPTLKSQLADAQKKLDDAKAAYAVDLSKEQAALDTALGASNTMTDVCVCFTGILDTIRGLQGPGFASAGMAIVTLIMLIVLCANEGCCSKPPSSNDAKTSDGTELQEVP